MPGRSRSARRASTARPGGGGAAWLAPTACVAVALAMRLWAHAYQPYVTVDGTEYIRFAESLLHGEAFASIFPPGYPVLIALARLAITDRILAAAAVSLVCGALLPLPVWWLARRTVGERWAVLPSLAVALHPELARISSVTMSEAAGFLALYTGLALLARPLLSGLALGAAFAIRPEALLSAAGVAAAHGLRVARRISDPRALAALAAGVLALAAPCWIYFRLTLGEWTVTPKAVALRAAAADWRPAEPRLANPEPLPPGALGRIGRDGAAALRTYPDQALGYARLLLRLWPWPLLLLALWGMARGPGSEWPALLPLLVLPLLGGLGLQPRLLLGALPALAILAARPLAAHPARAWRAALLLAWVAGAVGCGIANAGEFRMPFDSYQEDQKDAGRWLAARSDVTDPVMDRKPYVAFYANRPYRVMPDEPYDTLVAAAVRTGVRYLVLDEGLVRVFRPQLRPLLFDPAFRAREPRLEMVYVAGRFRGYNVAIFRVLQPGETKRGAPPHFDVRWLRPADS